MTRFAVFFIGFVCMWVAACDGTNWLDENLDATPDCEGAVLHVLECCKDSQLASTYAFACSFYAQGATESALNTVVQVCTNNDLRYGNPPGFDTVPAETAVVDPELPKASDLSAWSCEDSLRAIHLAYGAPISEQEDGDEDGDEDTDEDGDGEETTDGDTSDADDPDLCDSVDCSHMDTFCALGTCEEGNCVLTARNEEQDCSSTTTVTQCQQATCQAGQCVVEALPNSQSCTLEDNDNDCLVGVCTNGSCLAQAKANGEACNDDNLCTTNKVCSNGDCVGEPVQDCDDDNPCTVDDCNPNNGQCTHDGSTMEGNVCDDRNACTDSSTCQSGVCTGQATDCSDGLSCTEDLCLGGGACDNPLMQNTCLINGVCYNESQPNPQNGCQECRSVSPNRWTVDNTNACSDGNEQTGNDHCVSGACIGEACSCDETTTCCDGCVPQNEDQPCDDGNAGTSNERCHNGVCDASVCVCDTVDACCDGCRAIHVGESCDDQTLCSHSDVCTAQGVCQGQSYSCDDGLSCTTDSCTGVPNGCQNSVLPGYCQIVDFQSGLSNCFDDGQVNPDSPCQICRAATSPAWWSPNDGGTCNDNNVCTQTDTCQSGECVGSNPVSCPEDGDPCTDDVCDPLTGCGFAQSAAGTPCTDDGQFCTDDVCNIQGDCIHIPGSSGCYVSGVCYQPGDPNPAQTACQVCDPLQNMTAFSPANAGASCVDDDPCTENETCQSDGSCTGDPKVCGEDTDCQIWQCDSYDGSCSLSFTDNACEDGNPCTENDQCDIDTGVCEEGSTVADDTACDDQSDASVNDRCQSGLCEGDVLPLALVEAANLIRFTPESLGETQTVCLRVRVSGTELSGMQVRLQSPQMTEAVLVQSAPAGAEWIFEDNLTEFSGEEWQGDWTLGLTVPLGALPASLQEASLELGCETD